MMTTRTTRGPRPSARRALVAIAGVAVLALVASGCVVNGTWTALTLTTPVPSNMVEVSCPSETWCLAVEDQTGGGGMQVWDGSTWSDAPVPPDPSPIESMECFADDRCAAIQVRVGPWADYTWHLLLFDGSFWTEPAGVGDLGDGDPNLLSCPPDGCVVADTWDRMITWDGTTVVVEPQPGPIYALNMDCVTTDDCLAVSGGTSHWDGSTWTEVGEGSPGIDEVSGHLDCAGRTDRCVTVGDRWNGVAWVTESTVWDGAAWTEVPLPAGLDTVFSGLSCAGSFECVATGGLSAFGSPFGNPAVLTFIGDAWYSAPTPPGGPDARYGDVSCVAQTCIAVGTGTPPGGGAAAGIASRYHWTYP